MAHTHQYKEIDDAMPLTDETTPHDQLEYAELAQYLDKQIDSLPFAVPQVSPTSKPRITTDLPGT
ncbi:MAG: hypothetical protein IJE15_00485 [Bacteroidaceae bacterium]|nr:hypothetical protein [Bacteroidaceae bacterium]